MREALKRLQESGLIRISHGGATRVRDWRRDGGLDLLLALAAQGEVPPELRRSAPRSSCAPASAPTRRAAAPSARTPPLRARDRRARRGARRRGRAGGAQRGVRAPLGRDRRRLGQRRLPARAQHARRRPARARARRARASPHELGDPRRDPRARRRDRGRRRGRRARDRRRAAGAVRRMSEVLYYAIPFFVLLLVVEGLTYRHLRATGSSATSCATRARASRWGSATSRSTSSGSSPSSRSTRRSTSSRRCGSTPATGGSGCCCSSPTTSPTTAFHRVSHESRVFWASHVVHHSSQHYNLSTALRQTWVPMTYLPFWLPLPLLGFAPWMVLLAQSWSLIYQFWLHTERVGRLPRPLEAILNTPVAPPRPPRGERAVPRPQLRRHPRDLGPPVRQLRAGGRARALRADDATSTRSTRCASRSTSTSRSAATCAPRARGASRWNLLLRGPGYEPDG